MPGHSCTLLYGGNGPFFGFENGSLLTRTKFVEKVKEALALAGVDCKAYSDHNFCIEAATTAAKRGISHASNKSCWVG